MPQFTLPAGYEKIDGKKYPTKAAQTAAYSDIKAYVGPNNVGSFLYGKPRVFTMAKYPLVWPLDKIFITQRFGDNPKTYAPMGLKGHDGIDLRTRYIDSPLGRRYVNAAAAGWCEPRDDKKKGYGLHVRIHHKDGSMTIYGHLTKAYVAYGVRVSAGERIGLSGTTGFSSAPHLHFEYRPPNANPNNGFAGAIDPLPLLPPIK